MRTWAAPLLYQRRRRRRGWVRIAAVARGGPNFLALEVAAEAWNDHLTLAPVDLLRVVRWVQEKHSLYDVSISQFTNGGRQ